MLSDENPDGTQTKVLMETLTEELTGIVAKTPKRIPAGNRVGIQETLC